MAVKVYDRDHKEWTYERGAYAEFDEIGLVIRDESDKVIGGFNPNAWTHWADKAEEAPKPGSFADTAGQLLGAAAERNKKPSRKTTVVTDDGDGVVRHWDAVTGNLEGVITPIKAPTHFKQ